MVVRMRTTRGHAGNRRSHHKAVKPRLGKDPETGELHLKHRVSPSGTYRGRQVLDVAKREEKKAARRAREAEKATAETSEDTAAEAGKEQLDPQALSKS